MARITIGTRGSDLALRQSQIVKSLLLARHPGVEVAIKIITTQGDTNSNPIPLDSVGKGWFTKEIEQELLRGTIDAAVHSLKDLPEFLPSGLCIAAYPEREDARDILASNGNVRLQQLPAGSRVGTDSLRRKIQILDLRNDVTVLSIRGNVPTRIRKLQTENYDAVVLAAAGLKRLGLQDRIAEYFSSEQVTPAPGQGILAIEVREQDEEIKNIITTVNNPLTELVARAERNFSKIAGGGCKEPVGAYAVCDGKQFTLSGMIGTIGDRHLLVRDRISGPCEHAAELSGELARRMLKNL